MPAHSAGPFGTAGGAYYSIAPEGPNLRGNPTARRSARDAGHKKSGPQAAFFP